MKCEKVESTKLEVERTTFERRPGYAFGNRIGTIQLKFNLNLNDDGETFLSIFSTRMNAVVYRGPYRPSLSLDVDGRLAEDDGYDELEFDLLQLRQQRICRSANEQGYPFWRPGADITVAFLENGVFDEKGRFKEHNVTIHL